MGKNSSNWQNEETEMSNIKGVGGGQGNLNKLQNAKKMEPNP